MADWDVNSPSDSDFIAQFPANERAARAALVANFGVDHEANAQDANIGKHVKVSLVDQSSDPAGAAGSSTLYAKEASGASQLFWRSATGAVVQLTAAGGLRAESLVGTIADARLSSNVPLKDAPNVFTRSGGGTDSIAVQVVANAPYYGWTEIDQAANRQRWVAGLFNSIFRFGPVPDSFTGGWAGITPSIEVRRDEAEATLIALASSQEIDLTSPTLDFNGNVDISGTLAVGGAATFSNNVTVSGTITGNGSGLTSLNASNLSSGTVPNARLSSDVPLKNAPNVFTEQQTIQRTSSPTLTVERVGAASNAIIETKTTAGSVYFGNTNGSTFAIGATAGLSSPWAFVSETEFEVNANLLDFNGNADISGTLAVGGAATFSNNVTVSGTITGNGSGLSSLNASNLSSGTVPSDRLPSTIGGDKTFSNNVTVGGTISGNGSGLTNLNASNLSSGTVPDARLPATIGGNKTFSGNVTINGAVTAGTAATSTSATLVAGQIHHRSSNTTVPSMNAGQWVAVQNTSTSSITLSEGSGVTLELGGTTMTGNRTLLPKGFAFIYFRANGVGVVHGSGVT